MRRGIAAGLAAGVLLLGLAAPGGRAEAHHLGVFVPKDDEITASFKRMKVFLEQRRPDLLRKEFAEDRWVQRGMAALDARYGGHLVPDMERALRADDLAGAERTLVRFFCLVAGKMAQDALDGLGRAGLSSQQKADRGVKLLAAAWRYYNLVDYPVSEAAPKISSAARVSFEDAEYYLGKSAQGWRAFDEAKARRALQAFRDLMTEFVALPASAGAEARRP